jgi:hypothetical protein
MKAQKKYEMMIKEISYRLAHKNDNVKEKRPTGV